MGILNKIGKAKAKYSAWKEEKEQKEYNSLKTKLELSKQYNTRDKEKKKMRKEISKANKLKLENSIFGKAVKGLKNFDEKINSPKKKGKKKGKKVKLKRMNSGRSQDYDPWGGSNGGDGDPWA